nr:hypothetical protein [Oculatella sp. FACHB-28]
MLLKRNSFGECFTRTPNRVSLRFVGYLEQNDNVYFFATNIATQDEDDFPARIEVTRRSLKALGLF